MHFDSCAIFDELNNEEAGALIKAIIQYQSGTQPNLDRMMNIAFIPFKNQIDRDLEKYKKVCARNKLNGSKGGRPRTANSSTYRQPTSDPRAFQKSETPKRSEHLASIRDIFTYWKQLMGKNEAVLSDDRTDIIQRAIAQGYSVDVIKLAIKGCSLSEWNMGANDRQTQFNDIHTILKEPKSIERFIGIAKNGGSKSGRGAEIDSVSKRAIDAFVGESSVIDGKIV